MSMPFLSISVFLEGPLNAAFDVRKFCEESTAAFAALSPFIISPSDDDDDCLTDVVIRWEVFCCFLSNPVCLRAKLFEQLKNKCGN